MQFKAITISALEGALQSGNSAPLPSKPAAVVTMPPSKDKVSKDSSSSSYSSSAMEGTLNQMRGSITDRSVRRSIIVFHSIAAEFDELLLTCIRSDTVEREDSRRSLVSSAATSPSRGEFLEDGQRVQWNFSMQSVIDSIAVTLRRSLREVQ